jgi:hypothetical protein
MIFFLKIKLRVLRTLPGPSFSLKQTTFIIPLLMPKICAFGPQKDVSKKAH